ncbi:SDR family NAD(P)-dependent oxidoreductase [Streptomyces sp. NPDC056161]|uniref:SDR family NAD(P)-dependent oxidoreductase n=1 Tax=Streptomyces sp. NPDC056161 TaxID=3345732 RepID=UPI0035DB54E5
MTPLYTLRLVPAPAVTVSPERDPLPRGALVLTDDRETAVHLSRTARPDVTTVVVPPEAAAWDEDAITALLPAGDAFPCHIRVIASLHPATWPAAPEPRMLALQEAAFLAAKRLARSAPPDSSVVALVLDPFTDGAPHPYGALLTGLIKSLTWELPHTEAYAVVTDAATLPTALARLRHESGCVRGLPVAYYRGEPATGARWEERLLPVERSQERLSPVADAGPVEGLSPGDGAYAAGATAPPGRPGSGPVVLAVGGARGITARCLEGMRTPPSMLWLLGSTDSATMAANSHEIGTATAEEYVRRRRAAEPHVPIAELRGTYDRCRRSRESLAGLAALRQRFGAERVHYLGCDVTDESAVHRAAAVIRGVTPRIDLLVNGAGISGARRLTAKDLATFRKVRDTKVAGHHHLKSAFAASAPRLWCTFGSVAGAFGLVGESDYGPANDVLNAAARYEEARSRSVRGESSAHGELPTSPESAASREPSAHPDAPACDGSADSGAAEYVINWSLWGASGLGPRAGFTQYAANAGTLGLLADAEGQRLFNAEVEADRPGRAVPVPLGDAERRMLRSRFPALVDTPERRPYLGAPSWVGEDGAVWELDLAGYGHLFGHRRESRALLPGALALELAAEAADFLVGAAPVHSFRDIRFRAPIAVDPQVVRYVLTASFDPAGFARGTVRVGIRSRVVTGHHDRRVQHFDVLVPIGDGAGDSAAPGGRAAPQAGAGVRRAPAVMSMSGLFDQVRDVTLTELTATAGWEPQVRQEIPAQELEFFSRHRIPWLLADALLQTACATGTPNRYATPHSIGELTLHTAANDLTLSSRETRDVRLRVTHTGGAAAGDADGDADGSADGAAGGMLPSTARGTAEDPAGGGGRLLTMSGLVVSGREVVSARRGAR